MVKLYDHDCKKFVFNYEVRDSFKVSVLFSFKESYTFGFILGWLFLKEDLEPIEEKAIGLTMHRLVQDKKSISYGHFLSICSYYTSRGKHSPRFKDTDQYLKPYTSVFQRQLYRGMYVSGAIERGMTKRYNECLEHSIARNKYRTKKQ